MGFETISPLNKKYRIVKQHFLNKEKFKSNYWIYDSGRKMPYYFMCPNCNMNSTNINHLDTETVDSSNFVLDLTQVAELGGAGSMGKIIECSQCKTEYYVGIGYIEPNNGRDVFLIHTIIEIDKDEK
jgi:hypothetical protein